ncbi:fumarylacetoacetase [Kockovaella imperatae]|uniref:Fumarylacetoacetase n=1 Tax=Kockovaella imperatae TaxID=4999 RepID=A0A1Y1UBY8_9TREE|nr:fumarylacetoacetase [Kockovaella imperatae]ORX35529.1 fumarylacetoacetase [Kockovaella imperatae]
MSFLHIDSESPFSLDNLPFGVFSTKEKPYIRAGVAVGRHVIDLSALHRHGVFQGRLSDHASVFDSTSLNAFAALGRPFNQSYRLFVRNLLLADNPVLRDNEELRQDAIYDLDKVQMHLPMVIGDYTDFYAGRNHAYNVGVLFRGPENALQPNYLHLPVGYHGRASSVQISGQPVYRPNGQICPGPAPILSPCRKLDMELEIAAFICTPNPQGAPIPIQKASDHIFGFVLMNDWSARDIQAWEYVPLGPFNSKNFATTITPWVVLADAMEPFRVKAPDAPTGLLPYLTQDCNGAYDIDLTVDLRISGETHRLSRSNALHLCFSFEQMIAHHTITGCPLKTGDLFGSGTISGKEKDSLGSLLEMTLNGKEEMRLGSVSRTFLEDHDEVILNGAAGASGARVGFGPCIGRILPAKSL